MIFVDLVSLNLPDICLTGEEKPRKNLTQETCPDRGSNPGAVRDRRSCYRLLHCRGSYIQAVTGISRRGRLKGHIYIYIYRPFQYIGSKLDSFLRKKVFLFLLFSRRTVYIVRDIAKTFTSVGIFWMGLILFSKIFYVFDVVYVKSSSISC